MRSHLTDLRLLRLAAFYEDAHERFIVEIAKSMTQSKEIRDGLDLLTSPDDGHREAIAEEIQRISMRLGPQDHQDLLRAALLDVVEIEKNARDFYRAKMDEAHDDQVVRLFQRLALEEERHRRLAERLVETLERTEGTRDHAPYAEGLQFLHDLETFVRARPAKRPEAVG